MDRNLIKLKLTNLSDDKFLERTFHTLNPIPHRDEHGQRGRGDAASRTESQRKESADKGPKRKVEK